MDPYKVVTDLNAIRAYVRAEYVRRMHEISETVGGLEEEPHADIKALIEDIDFVIERAKKLIGAQEEKVCQ